MSLFHAKIEGVPQFVSYFPAVHRAMQHFGGQATPKQVYAFIAEHEGLTEAELEQKLPSGEVAYVNRTRWARLYLTKA